MAGGFRALEWSRITECAACAAGLTEPRAFLPTYVFHRRGGEYVLLEPFCPVCYAHKAAMLEAEAFGWRYTFCPEQCSCGARMPIVLNECPLCWRERRMLDKRQADINFNRRLVAQLRRAIRGDEDRRVAGDAGGGD